MTEIVGFQIEVGGTDAEVEQLGRLKAEIFATEAELRKLRQATQGNVGAQKAAREQFAQLEGRLKATRSEYNKGQREILKNSQATQNAAGSYNALVAETRVLQQRLKALPNGFDATSKEVQELTARITTNTNRLKQFDAQIGQNQRNVGNYGSGIKSVTGTIGRLAGGLGLAVGGVAAVGSAITGAVKTINTFESSIANVFTLLSKDDLDKFQSKLERGSREIIAKYGFEIENVNKALFDAISAGVPAGESIEFLNEASELAIGGVTDLSTATDGLTTILNAYKLETDATGQVADAFFSAQKAGKTTVEELSNEVGKVAPIANVAGVSFQELLASTAALTKGGISTAEATTALQGTLTSLVKPAKDAEAVLREFGVPVGITEVRAAGFTETLSKLNQVVKENPDEIARAIPNIRGLTGVLALSEEGFEDYSEILQQVNEDIGENSSLSEAFALQQQTVEQRINRLGGAYDGFILSLNEGSGAISNAIGAITDFGTAILETLTAVNEVDFDKPQQSALGLLEALEGVVPGAEQFAKAAREGFKEITDVAEEEAQRLSELTEFEQEQRLRALENIIDREKKVLEDQFAFNLDGTSNVEKGKTELAILQAEQTRDALLRIREEQAAQQAEIDEQAAEEEKERQERLTKEQEKELEKRLKAQQKAREEINKALGDLEVQAFQDDQARAIAAEDLKFERAVEAAEKRRALFAKDAEEQELINVQIQLLTETHLNKVAEINQKFREQEAKERQDALKDQQQFLQEEFDSAVAEQDERLQISINNIALQGLAAEEARLAELEAEQIFFEERLALLEQFGEDTTLLQQEIALQQQEIDDAKTAVFIANAQRAADTIKQGIQSLSNIFVAAQNSQLAAFDQRAKRELETFKGTEEEKAKLEEKLNEDREQIERQFARRQKELGVVTALIDTALAVVRALRNPPGPPGSIPQAVAAGIQGAAQVAVIQSQRVEKGGILRGPRHAQGGIHVEAEGDEIVLTKGVYQNPRLRSLASQLNVAGGGVSFENGGIPVARLQEGAVLPSIDSALQRQTIIGEALAPDFAEIGSSLAETINDQKVILEEGEVTETQRKVEVTESLAEI